MTLNIQYRAYFRYFIETQERIFLLKMRNFLKIKFSKIQELANVLNFQKNALD
jgi:hypothetical protein